MTEADVGPLMARIISLSMTLHQKGPDMAADLSKITADVATVAAFHRTQSANLETAQALLAASDAANTALQNELALVKAELAAVPPDNQSAIDALVAQLAPIVSAANGTAQAPSGTGSGALTGNVTTGAPASAATPPSAAVELDPVASAAAAVAAVAAQAAAQATSAPVAPSGQSE